jgi:Trypsin
MKRQGTSTLILLSVALTICRLFSCAAAHAEEKTVAGRDAASTPGRLDLDTRGVGINLEKLAEDSKKALGERDVSKAGSFAPFHRKGELIIGGESTSVVPEHAGQLVVEITFQNWDGAPSFCSGTLVGSRQVLTAGHCGCGKVGTYEVKLRENARDTGGSHLPVSGAPVLYDHRICHGGAPFGSDLALLKLSKDVACNTKDFQIQIIDGDLAPGECKIVDPGENTARSPLNIVSASDQDAVWNLRSRLTKGKRLTAVGYGFTETGSQGIRLKAEIPILSVDCEERFLASICAPFAEIILAGRKGDGKPVDTCGGDSGGPVFLYEGNAQKLIAVTSRAGPGPQDPWNNCGGGGVYTLLGRKSVMTWLAANGVPNPLLRRAQEQRRMACKIVDADCQNESYCGQQQSADKPRALNSIGSGAQRAMVMSTKG